MLTADHVLTFVAVTAILSFLGGIAATVVFFAGVPAAGSVAFLLGAVALTGGLSVSMGPLDASTLPNADKWPHLPFVARGSRD